MSTKVAIAYIPVLHKGYVDFITQLESEGISELYVIGDEILAAHEELDYINRKDRLRAVPLRTLVKALQAISGLSIKELTLANTSNLSAEVIVTPREDISEVVVQQYYKKKTIDYRNVFVRRDKHALHDTKLPNTFRTIPMSAFTRTVWSNVLAEAQKSADWYRQVGAALVKDGQVVYVTHNEHMPEEQLPNIEGDARALFKRGIHINYGTAAHAEEVAIGTAAKEGISTKDAELFVTEFPCPYCARLIAKAGIKTVYFLRGYAVLDGDDFLKEEGVELIKVEG